MAEVTQSQYNEDTYVMVESEVYYEPYYHVLRALQDPGFPNQIAMSKYIIQVDVSKDITLHFNKLSNLNKKYFF